MREFKYEDLSLGQSEEFSVVLTKEMMDLFLRISGDTNPLHVDAVYAKSKGFKDQVAYGMLVASFYSQLVGVYLPGRFCLLHGIETSFHKPAFITDTLHVSGEITYLNAAYRQIEIKASIRNQSEDIISKAKIKAGTLE